MQVRINVDLSARQSFLLVVPIVNCIILDLGSIREMMMMMMLTMIQKHLCMHLLNIYIQCLMRTRRIGLNIWKQANSSKCVMSYETVVYNIAVTVALQ